ncbi:MAG: hypothetical protein J6T04_03875 [Bacteroidales bacterium]|nr:hypothetical protein [Bacteroidales bacterium]
MKSSLGKYWYILLLVLVLIALAILFFARPSHDKFGKNHPIPDGLEYSLPLDSTSMAQADTLDSSTYLVIRNGVQGGVYKYDFYYGPLPAGEIYLKCFEATENIPLSADEIQERSKVAVDSTSAFSRLVSQQEFSIYEGEWEDYYAARIEVWFKNAATNQETKLLEKVYRVEGWMR